jgi:hypothetical protein
MNGVSAPRAGPRRPGARRAIGAEWRLAFRLALSLCAARNVAAQSAVVPVVAIGEGRTFSSALTAAVRMAVESGAGATVASAVSSTGERIATDSVRTVSRGVVTRYAVLDSSADSGGARVRILAMVSRISERDAVGARAQRVAAPGALWTAGAALDADRRADEGRLLAALFGAIDRQPSAYGYQVETGPPVPAGAALRLRLRVIRSPGVAYVALRERARSVLSAVAGAAGVRTTHLPPLPGEQVEVRPCVSHCAADERRVLSARVALDDTDSLGTVDPPVITGPGATHVPTLFPDLRTAGGFAVAFTDSAKQRQQFVHIRSTRGYLAVADYLRATFDDARFRLQLANGSLDLLESFRAPWTGQPQPRFASASTPGAPRVALVQGFRQRTVGGPGAPTTLGSPYVVLSIPGAETARADTALVDIWLSPAQLSRITEVTVAPIATTHRLPEINCAPAKPAGARSSCARPDAVDVMWQSLDDGPRGTDATVAPPPAPANPAGPAADDRPARHPGQLAGQPVVPLAVLDAITHPPLADGDGAVSLPAAQSMIVAVASAVVDPASPTAACSVARLRAQRELTRFISGSRLEGRIGLSTSENRGGQVQESFRDDISETVAGRLAGGALAAQWTVNAPPRCRVALWLSGEPAARRDSTVRRPR